MTTQSKKGAGSRTTATFKQEIQRLAEAMTDGRLDERGDIASFSGEDAEILASVNQMLDALVSPLRLASGSISEIAHGRIPPFVIDDYKGEFNSIKLNLNTLLATLYGLHKETQNLISGVSEGKLRTRGNDWDFDGIWKELIAGVNGTLDAVLDPVSEASAVLERLANYDLKARMSGKYRGEHAAIRKAMNSTAGALHDAISQVSETVGLVSDVGEQITRISSVVTKGAEEQSVRLNETSASLATLSESANRSARSTAEANENALKATESIQKAKESMNPMVKSMDDIGQAAGQTSVIAQEIDDIARETGHVATGAAEKAVKMRISAAGFGVVAHEVGELSKKCSQAANRLKEFEKKIGSDIRAEYLKMIENQLHIAHFSNLLGVNAAIEAAHIQGTGKDFKEMTDQINNMATRSAEAAKKTGTLTEQLSSLSNNGMLLSQEIQEHLENAVMGAHALGAFSDGINATISEQTTGLKQISDTAAQISQVTEKNAEGAAESLVAAKNLDHQVRKLSTMVNRFSF